MNIFHSRLRRSSLLSALLLVGGGAASAAVCINSAGSWQSTALPSQGGSFTAEFDSTPGTAKLDGVAGLSNGAASSYTGLAAVVRFNNLGAIDARNGAVYAAAAAIPYQAGLSYHFRLVVNVAAHTYSAYVKQGANAEKLIGLNYAFRAEQASVANLNALSLLASSGSQAVCSAAVTSALPGAAPVISAVSVSGVGQDAATINWTTDKAADTQASYGPTSAYGSSTALNAAPTTVHSAALGGLAAGTLYHYQAKSRDSAGNMTSSPDATFTTAAASPAPAPGCLVSAGTWQNAPMPPQTGAFTAEFDSTPGMAKMDGVAGLAGASVTGYAGLAAAARFNNTGVIDARNGAAYAAIASIPYQSGLPYHFRLVVNVSAHTYSAYVKQGANAEQTIGLNYAFRTEQASVAALNGLALLASSGNQSVCAAAVTAPGGPGPVAALNENFSSYAKNACLADGTAFGPWTSSFGGYGCTSVKTDGVSSWLDESPFASVSAAETHSSLVLGPSFAAPMSLSVDVKTAAQLRTNTPPNPWEVGWVFWGYADNTHFYYFQPKPNGWELGKEDPAYPGAQRFLATGSTPVYPVGGTYTVKIVQNQNVMTVYVNGALVTTFTDTERPYASGRIGLYNEDSNVRFTNVVVETGPGLG